MIYLIHNRSIKSKNKAKQLIMEQASTVPPLLKIYSIILLLCLIVGSTKHYQTSYYNFHCFAKWETFRRQSYMDSFLHSAFLCGTFGVWIFSFVVSDFVLWVAVMELRALRVLGEFFILDLHHSPFMVFESTWIISIIRYFCYEYILQ